MFELENEIGRWKQSVVGEGVVSSEEASELESHLRESVASLGEKGLTTEEAFMVGASRLGHPLALQKEYAKNNLSERWRQRVFWMLAGYLGLKVTGGVVSVIGTTTGAVMAYGGFGGSTAGFVMIALMAMAWSSVFVISFRGRHRLANRSDGFSLKWIGAIGALLALAPGINMFGRLVPLSFVSKAWYGEASYYLSIGGLALNFFIATICFIALCKLNDRREWHLD